MIYVFGGLLLWSAWKMILGHPPFEGTPVVPFCPFCLGVSLLKQNSRHKGTLIIYGLLGNLVLRT